MTARDEPRIGTYVLDGGDEDLRRLMVIAEVQADSARRALHKVGDMRGMSVIECGCGPLGCLAVLSELVGPEGRVIGVDAADATAERARSVAAALSLDNVTVLSADVHELDLSDFSEPFDLAYTRAFLMHQADPKLTMARIARLLRPGGWLVTQEPLRKPPPTGYPTSADLERYWELLHEAAAKSGAAPDAAETLLANAVQAGFESVATGGFFNVMASSVGYDIHATGVHAMRSRLLRTGVATEEELDALELALRAAAPQDGWVTSPFMLELILRRSL